MKKFCFLTLCLVLACCTFFSCTKSNPIEPTDYSMSENWMVQDYSEERPYDLIFFYGTAVLKPTQENGIADICDSMRTGGMVNYMTVGEQLSFTKSSKGNEYKANVFIPLYRQVSLSYALENCSKHEEYPAYMAKNEPLVDLKAAMDYYFENFNKDAKRPFVIAGHSQGGSAVQIVLENYFIKGGHKEYLKNLVAAYSIGYGVSKEWFDGLNKSLDGKDVIHAATGATDINCLISWNTEGPDGGDGNFLLPDKKFDTYLINPLNWKTDETPATKEENLGVAIRNTDNAFAMSETVISHDEKDLFNAQINLERGSLISSENNGVYAEIASYEGPLWGGKSLHTFDGAAFYVNMSVNLGDRLDACFGK